MIILPYLDCKYMIYEGDVLLFRAPPFPAVGWWITKYTGGPYSHVALAHWDGDNLYCVEQREFKGGRSVLLDRQIQENPSRIDVFRAKPRFSRPRITFKDNKWSVEYTHTNLTYEIKRQIVETALKMTGKEYGWKNIWKIFKAYAPGFRMVSSKSPLDDAITPQAYVCSTLVANAYRTHYADPCPNLNDDRTTPDDIGRSALFDYLFTIQ